MVVTPVDQQDVDIGSLERACGRNAGKSAANNYDTFLAGGYRHERLLFLRKAFGQNRGHG
jgi:hypothetical protein